MRILAAVVLSIVLGACAGGGQEGTLASGTTGTEPARYDASRAERLVRDAQEAAARGDLAAAETAFEGALDAWPVSKPAWEGLAEVYREQGHQEDLEVASFFAARMDWVATVPPLVAGGAFGNVAEGRVKIAQDNPKLRRRSTQLVDFLRSRDARTRDASYDEEIEYWKLAPAVTVSVGFVILGGVALFGVTF